MCVLQLHTYYRLYYRTVQHPYRDLPLVDSIVKSLERDKGIALWRQIKKNKNKKTHRNETFPVLYAFSIGKTVDALTRWLFLPRGPSYRLLINKTSWNEFIKTDSSWKSNRSRWFRKRNDGDRYTRGDVYRVPRKICMKLIQRKRWWIWTTPIGTRSVYHSMIHEPSHNHTVWYLYIFYIHPTDTYIYTHTCIYTCWNTNILDVPEKFV